MKDIIYIMYLFPWKQIHLNAFITILTIYLLLFFINLTDFINLIYVLLHLKTTIFFHHRIIVIFCASCQYRRLLKSMKQYQASSPSASPSHNNAMITSSAPAGHNKAVGATSLPTTDNPSYQSLGKPTEKYTHTPKLFHEYAYPY